MAHISALEYADYDPIVISFGAPSAVMLPCNKIVERNHYRVVSSWIYPMLSQYMMYDIVPMITAWGAEHIGHAIFLGDKTLPTYMGLHEQGVRSPYNPEAHWPRIYLDGAKAFRDEMISEQIVFTTIGRRGNEDRCNYDDECLSGRCDEVESTGLDPLEQPKKKMCLEKVALGEDCNEHSDCVTNHCLSHKCQPAKKLSGLRERS